LAGDVGLSEVAHAARAAPAAPASSARPQDLLLDGFTVAITEGYAAGAPRLKEAIRAFRTTDLPVLEAMRWLWPATHAARDLWDDESFEELSARWVKIAREAGALATLPIALNLRGALHLFAGELTAAASLADEIAAVSEATGRRHPRYTALALAAFRGRDAEAAALIHTASAELVPRGDGLGLTLVEHAKAVLYNGLGRYPEACTAARLGAAHPIELGYSNLSLPQLIEAAVRSDQRGLAEDAMRRLTRITTPSGTDWALGIEARSRALVSGDDEAEGYYRDAIDHLGRTRVRAEHARAHLLYGEWLRREGRRAEAREHLRTAQDMFGDMGMEAFAERTRRERLATGETVRKRQTETRDELTPQEAQIAQLARTGLTNPEIGGQLFLSARTVEWHLKKIFTKLGITSRRGLQDALSRRNREPTIA
jgi:DNA-binding CsgD family transcriptional regulator